MPADRRPTMSDVAARAGVSRALVSVVFRDAPGAGAETRARVLTAAAELGYVRDDSARSLRTGRTYLLGVVFDTRDDFHADLLDACYRAAGPQGYELLLSAVTPSRTQARAVATLFGSRVAGILLFGAGEPPEVSTGPQRRTPLVVVGHHAGTDVDVVATDEGEGIRQAVDHLIAHGHRRIACLAATRHQSGAARSAAYRSVMAERGLADFVRVVPGGFTQLDGSAAGRELLAADAPLPTAVLASNDLCGVGLLQTLRTAGIEVPGQVSIMGFDGSQVGDAPDVQLSTVAQDTEGLAQQAMRVLRDRDARVGHGIPAPRHYTFAPRLVLRATTGPAR
ncbi:MAG: LacI family DNA-binding transcriptional regulator [Janthinobacterium lividum]